MLLDPQDPARHGAEDRDLDAPLPGVEPPSIVIEHGKYRVRFARTERDLDAALRLRYQVFNEEMGEGLERSEATGRDEDRFDRHCHHLLVEELGDECAVVGTYRMQTGAMAQVGQGFYSAAEYDLDALPAEVIAQAVEVGRACIARSYRNRQVLFLLWKGLAAYISTSGKRYLFGCCSLTSQDPVDGYQAHRQLEADGRLDAEISVPATESYRCSLSSDQEARLEQRLAKGERLDIPALFKTYMRYGATILSQPAIDREFKTLDFFVLLDVAKLSPRSRQLFFDS